MDNRVTATIVGSYPKPDYVLGISGRELLDSSGEALDAREQKEGKGAFRKLIERAIIETVRDQEDAGLDVITDGEQGRGHYIYYVLRRLEGFDFKNRRAKAVEKVIAGEVREAFDMKVSRVTGPIRRTGEIAVSDYRYLAGATSVPVKTALPGPATVVDAVANEHYGSDEELAFAYADAIRGEVAALYDAGCRIVQFDDPALLRDVTRAEAWGVRALERCFADVTGLTTIVHVCRSYPNKELEKRGIPYKSDEAYYPQLLDMLQETIIDQISIEGKQGNLNPAVLRHLGSKRVLYGCVDCGIEEVESVSEILAQARAALQYIAPGQLTLAPDCGLLQISRKAAKAKLANLAKAATVLNGEKS